MKTQSKSVISVYIFMLIAVSLCMPMIIRAATNKGPVAGGASPVVSVGAPIVHAADVNHGLKISNTTTENVTIRYKSIKDGAEVDLNATINPNQSIEIVKKPGTDVIYTSKDCVNCLLVGDAGGAAIIQAKK